MSCVVSLTMGDIINTNTHTRKHKLGSLFSHIALLEYYVLNTKWLVLQVTLAKRTSCLSRRSSLGLPEQKTNNIVNKSTKSRRQLDSFRTNILYRVLSKGRSLE